MFKEYAIFTLKKPLSEAGLAAGTKGVVLVVYGGSPPAYEVEFPDGEGGNLGADLTYTITEEYMQYPTLP